MVSSHRSIVRARAAAPLLLLLLPLALACGDRKSGKAAPPSGVPDDAAATTAPPAAGAVGPADAIDDRELAALLDRWLAAQNQGDLAAYEQLYATRMTGIKRVGFRVFPFDRKGWLADRARMFQAKHPMTVTAEAPHFHAGARSATIDFVQTFSQGSFKDRGPKQLVVVREAAAPSPLRIAREEMLASTLDPGATRAIGDDAFLFVIEIAGRPHVVLDLDADPSWGGGPLQPPVDDSPYAVLRAVGDGLPPDKTAWRDRTVTVYSATGERCEKTLASLAILGAVTPHFSTVAAWAGNPVDAPEGTKPLPLRWDQIAAEIMAMASDSLVLVAPLGSCKGVFASADPKRPSVLFSKQPADDALTAKVMAAARALPSYQRAQTEFIEQEGGSGDWVEESEVATFENAKSGRRFVTATLRSHGSCVALGWVFALWELDARGGLSLLSDPAGELTIEPDALLDVDGDGRLEVVGPTSDFTEWSLVTIGAPSTPVKTLRFPYLDCGC